jgi:hypothetical protein
VLAMGLVSVVMAVVECWARLVLGGWAVNLFSDECEDAGDAGLGSVVHGVVVA